VTRSCGPYPELVGARNWLPTEPFEYGWAAGVGCNNLRCERCGEPVRAEVLPGERSRRYACGCRQLDVAWSTQVGVADDDLLPPFRGWACQGHPDFPLPTTLDGVPLDAGTDWGAVAAAAIRRPPFEPPGIRRHAAWLIRLYHLLDAERAPLSRAIAGLLDADDPVLVRGALDFLLVERSAPGAERIAGVLTERRERLSATPDPRHPSQTLLDSASDLLLDRLLDAASARGRADPRELAVAKELALAGVGHDDVLLALSKHDPKWLWANAGGLVRANEEWAAALVRALTRTTAARRKRILPELAAIAPDRVRGAIEQHIREPERSDLLASIGP
jgi:hypothetical protein